MTLAYDTGLRLRSLPPGLRSELEEAAYNHGYRRQTGEADGWFFFASDINVPGEIGLAVAQGGSAWFLTVGHAGVATELNGPPAQPVPQGMRAAYGFTSGSEVRQALHRAYALACSLPTLPLYEFQEQIAGLGGTEAERLVKRRVGQEVFRRALDRYWDSRCPLTGISDRQMLRGSHILPWADCSSDAERLDVHNGLLLSAHWDAAFDAGLVSFSDDGVPLLKEELSAEACTILRADAAPSIPLSIEHNRYLHCHRKRFGF